MAGRRSRAAPRAKAKQRGVSWATVKKLALAFPGVSEGRSYGGEAFLLDGKFFSRFNPKEEALVIYVQRTKAKRKVVEAWDAKRAQRPKR